VWNVTAVWRGRDDGVVTTLASVIRVVDAHLVGIAGPPGGGKSTFARSVADELGDALVVSLDDYYLSQKERHDHGLRWRGPPGSHDLVGLLELLDRIRNGSGPITVQRFSAEIDDRIEPTTLPSVPPHVLLEGWVLGHRDDGYEQILDRLDLFVFLDIDEKIARARRFARETRLREHGGGFSEDEMQRFWDEVLEPGMQRWVRTAREGADLVIEVNASDELLSARTTSEAVVSALEDR
jgi:uridine kinase